MKTLTLLLTLAATSFATAQNSYVSIQQEIEQSIARGNAWLKTQQKAEGHWDDEGLPAFSALALTAISRDPNETYTGANPPDFLKKGFSWLVSQQKEDGGIYNRGLSVYNTATSLTALVSLPENEYETAIIKARRHLVENQWDIDEKGKTDNSNDGGIGYGSSNDHTDMSNTYLALEALALSSQTVKDIELPEEPELDWEAALTFLSRSQNLTATNDQKWASDDAKNKGGFIYTPGDSKAGEETTEDGKVALRSYGSISYAGLLSLVYANVGPEDPRVVAVKEWLGKNYTVSENPNMGAEGLYYYFQAMAKALNAAGVNELKLADGTTADWRKDLAGKLLSLQRSDGSWANENGRWMESNPVLVTAYTVMALEEIHRSIP
ncbi:prenyltransferase/squalene oxidase repeat-containing protein [Luteolibacter sp. AS25]|uniref:prenyltransferase/squalene oxidase repeat-containing protein n=1 Tax=Luteolibacter sp. AS25 TaxID=3135776 RepID=UPI00398B3C11